MKAIGEIIEEKNLQLATENPVLRDGFYPSPQFHSQRFPIVTGGKSGVRKVLELRMQ
jgi:hypothetical protein